ncbi:MAG: hypothetical protein KatS3mg109_0429 [Pirellulaceae bacterium]|nr:MAG: hypothetical protein KatS3mg109_0429 [Pirellulaceae bacterium]
MTVSTDLIAPIRCHLEQGTSPDRAVAFQRMPHFCRKFFKLETLIELLRKEAPVLRSGGVFELVRDEVVRRLLITADRGRWRATALEILRLNDISDVALLRFMEQHYHARNADFAISEGKYLQGLQEVYMASSTLRGPVYDALAWFAALPDPPRNQRFRVLFSNQAYHSHFPTVFIPGVCVSFSLSNANCTEPFARYDIDRLGPSFRRAAEEAEIKAYEICGKTFGPGRHRRVRIEDNLEDLSVLDGTSGYLAFLMVHVCLMKGVPLSPYVGFTGAFRDFQRLGTVTDLPQKVAAAIDAGMRVLFVPRGNLTVSAEDIEAGGILRIVYYDEYTGVERVAENIVEQLLALQAELTPVLPSAPDSDVEPPASVSVRADRALPAEPVPIAEPRKLFKSAQLGCFIECGGYDGLQSPAKMSVFNSEDACFVTIFPSKRRVYRFDSFGALYEKFRSDAIPLCIAWNQDRCEYLISFNDYRIRRFNAQLAATGSLPVPIEPRVLVSAGDDVYVSDLSDSVIHLSIHGGVQEQIALPGNVCHLAYSDARRSLIASTGKCVVGLGSDLRVLWKIDHFANRSTVAATPSGELWIALSSGHLWRLGRDNQKLVDVSIPPSTRSLAAIEGAVVLGTLQGQLVLYDKLGSEIGAGDLQTTLYHVDATEGDMLALSTAKGPTVVKPLLDVTLRTRDQAIREQAMAYLLEWERAAQSRSMLHRVLKEQLRRIDLTRWQEVCALQSQFAQRKMLQPALYDKIETALRFIDPRKADRICAKTTPVIIDGSNVSRYHWNNGREGKKRARLAAILRMKEKLAHWTNPVYYPLIIVIDASERHYTDDLACLKRMIDEGEILECPSRREADVLILNLVRDHEWQDCRIVSNDRKLFNAHAEMFPGIDRRWYEKVRMAFTINPATHEVYFPERSSG